MLSRVFSKLGVSRMVWSNRSLQAQRKSPAPWIDVMSTVMLADAREYLPQRTISNNASHCYRKLRLVHFFSTNMSGDTVGRGGRLFSTHDNPDEEILEEVRGSNDRYLGKIELRKGDDSEWRLFSTGSFPKGATVISSRLMNESPQSTTSSPSGPKPSPCAYSIQIDSDKHILLDLPARFLNHSCDPNVGVRGEETLNEWGAVDFVALKDIGVGEEIRYDYETSEYEISGFSKCSCGASDCRGHIKGFKSNGGVILAKYGGKNIAPYLLRS
mmetsp:Transcript_30859/g.63594  ORF Transcript_30859/g.63594 Transcript_30859/m.63594 type:complete len:271 (-) Transcript_30859:641-1453(-)